MRYVTRWLRVFTHPLVIAAYMVLIILAYAYADRPLALYFHALNLKTLYPVLGWITQLGRSSVYLVVLPLVALFFRYLKRRKQTELRWWFVWSTLVMTTGICFILKNILGRARPDLLFDHNIFGFFGWHMGHLYHSFPSGHTTAVTTMILSLTLLFPKYRWGFIVTGILVLMTRVLLTYHYLSDVLATLALVMLEYRLLLYVVTRECPLYWVRLRLTHE